MPQGDMFSIYPEKEFPEQITSALICTIFLLERLISCPFSITLNVSYQKEMKMGRKRLLLYGVKGNSLEYILI